MNCSTPGLPVHHQLPSPLRLTSIESVMPSSHLILCRPLLLLPPIPPNIRVFSNESTLRMRWPKYWSFSFSISPSKEHPGLISFRMNWLELFAMRETWLQIGKILWRRAWQPTPVFLPGEPHEQRSLVGYSPWGRKESDMTERLSTSLVPPRSDQIRSFAQSCPTLCDPKNRSTPGLPVHHQLPEFTQTHVH